MTRSCKGPVECYFAALLNPKVCPLPLILRFFQRMQRGLCQTGWNKVYIQWQTFESPGKRTQMYDGGPPKEVSFYLISKLLYFEKYRLLESCKMKSCVSGATTTDLASVFGELWTGHTIVCHGSQLVTAPACVFTASFTLWYQGLILVCIIRSLKASSPSIPLNTP